MEVHITAEDILTAIRNTSQHCPIAMALARKTNSCCAVIVDGAESRLEISKGDGTLVIIRPLSPEALKFVAAFDAGEHVFPQIIQLISPTE